MLARIRVVLLCALLAASGLTVAAASAAGTAATVNGVRGDVNSAVQRRDGSVVVTGWVFRARYPTRGMWLCIRSATSCSAQVYTQITRTDVNNHFHITGAHGFQAVLPRSVVGGSVALRDWPDGSPTIASLSVSTPGARIVSVAQRYVDKSPYRSGGASPSGFDCSGFTLYTYAQAQVAGLPHNSEAQRWAPYMHRIWRDAARPGDLVFYLSGSYAYHVAVYAGHGMQYAATEPGQKIRYQRIWSSHVEYRTDWH